jgi:hypothetical protein
MRRTIIVAALLAIGAPVGAQEKLSREEALRFAFAVCADLRELQDTPIPTDPDVKRPVAVREGEYGCMVLPETKLAAEAIAKADKAPVPIGQIWLHKVAPIVDWRVVGREDLKLVAVSTGEGPTTASLHALAVRKDDKGGLELLVYGKGKEPILRAPLRTIESRQENPIEIAAERTYDGATVTLKILGKYEASFTVSDPDLHG